MNLSATEYVLGLSLLVIAAVVSAALASLAYRRRGSPGALSLAAMMAAGSFWAAAHALEFASQDPTLRSVFGSLKYVGVVAVPVLWLTFALRYTGRMRRLSGKLLASLSVVPLITLALVFTSGFHDLVRSYTVSFVPGVAPDVSHGPWFWAHTFYSYSLLAAGTYLLLSTLSGAFSVHRGQRVAIAIGALVPWGANAVYIFELIPSFTVDPTPFAFSLTGAMLLWGAYRSGLLELAPVARKVVFESMREGVLITDGQGRIVDANPAVTDMLGVSASEMVGLELHRLIPEIEEARRQQRRETVGLQSDGAYNLRYRRDDGSGSQRTYESELVALDHSESTIAAAKLVLVRDVTRRAEAEEELKESEERFRQLFEQSADALLVHDERGRMVDCNAEACRSLGYSREELLSMSVEDFVSEGLLPERERTERRDETLWRRAISAEPGATVGHPRGVHRRKDGSTFPVEVAVGPIDYGGRKLILAAARDITARERAEKALEESEKRFRSVVDYAADAVIVHDVRGNIADVNRRACESLGYTREELLCLSITDIETNLSPDRILGVWRQLDPGEPVTLDGIHRRKDGSAFPVEVRLGVFPHDGERLMVALARDVTERQRDREQLVTTAARLSSLVESLPSGILVEDEARNIRHANRMITEMFEMEISSEELVRENCDTSARDVMDLLAYPRDFVDRIEEILEHNQVVIGEEIYFADGRVLERDYVPIFVDEHYKGHLWHYRDLTARKQAEQALQESEQRFKSAFEDASAGVALIGLDNRYLRVNPALCEMIGYPEEELLGKTSFEFTHPEDMDESRERSRRMLAEGGPQTVSLEKRYLHKDGSVVWATSDVSLVQDTDGQPAHFVSQFHDITRRKLAEEELQRQRDLLRTIIDSAGETVFVKDFEHRFILSNRSHQEVLGAQSQDELLGKTNADVWGERRAAPHHADDRRVMDCGESLIGREEEIVHASGERRWLSTTKVPLRNPDGRVTGLVAVSRDVTDRKRYEKALQESERRLVEAQSLARVGSWEWDVASGSISWSTQQYRNFGLAPEEFEPTFEGFLDHVHPDDRNHMARAHRESLTERGPFEWEYRLVRPDGQVRDMHTRGLTFTDEHAEPVRMAGADHDITERKAAEEALRQSEERFRQLFEQSVDALIVHDAEGRIMNVNPETCRSLGYTRQELLEMSIPDLTDDLLTPEEKRERERTGGTLWQRIVAGDPAARNVVHQGNHKHKDGTTFPIEVRVGGVDYGRERMILASVRDVTERKRAEEALMESEVRFKQLFEQSVEALLVHDEEGRYVDVNAQACRLYGYSREEFLSLSVHDVACEMLAEEEKARRERGEGTLWQQVMSSEPGVFGMSLEEENVRKDGTTFTAEISLGSVDYGGRRLMLVAIRDVTERKRAEEALQESERRLRTVTSGAPVVLFAMDREGILTFEDGTALRTLGVEPGQNIGRSLFKAYPHLPEIHDYVRQALEGEEVTATVEIADRTYHAHYSPHLGEEREVVGVLGVATDITDRRDLENELEFRASHDPLTGLPNRSLFEERLSAALSSSGARQGDRHGGNPVAVLFMDLDNFKGINDSLGHEAGDELLVTAAERLRECLRPPDTVARLGGDEFAVLLGESGSEGAKRVAQRIRAKLREPFSLGGVTSDVTGEPEEVIVEASVGIALSEPGPASGGTEEVPAELLRQADLAMYSSKDQGSGYAFFEPWMDEQVQERLKLEHDLRRAIRRLESSLLQPGEEEFVLYYQPKVRLDSGRIVGMEALLRWEHPERGLLSPKEFVPMAEDLGLMAPLGRWALRVACRKAQEWRELYLATGDQPQLLMSVNLSASELRDSDLVEEVAATLTESGLPPGSLVLEISEEAAVADAQPAVDALRRLKELGVGLALDDFGTGYSSLSYLRDLPLDYVKIDRSLVSGMMPDTSNHAIVSATVSLAHALGLEVTAEGAETAEEAAELGALGCELGQGFYWHPPSTATDIQRLLENVRDVSHREPGDDPHGG